MEMEDEDILHWQRLISEHKRHLHVLEEQAAGHGKLNVPPHIVLSIKDANNEVTELTQRIRRRMQGADDSEVLYNTEEVNEIYDRTARIAHLGRGMSILEGLIKIFRSVFEWKYQDKKTRFFVILIIIIIVNSLVQGVKNILYSPALGDDNFLMRLIVAVFLVIVYIVTLFFVWRSLNSIYDEIGDLEKNLQEDEEELRRQREELSKIYKLRGEE